MSNRNGTEAAAVEYGQLASNFANTLKAWNSNPSIGNRQQLEQLRARIDGELANNTDEVDSDALAAALADEKKRADTLQAMAAMIGELLDSPGPSSAGLDILGTHDPNPDPLTWFVASGDPAQNGFGWMPDATVSVMSGPGMSGKSRIALQLAVATATGAADFILPSGKKRPLALCAPQVLIEGPVVYAAWETRKLAWQNRLAAVCRDAGADTWTLLDERLRYVNMKPTGGLWGAEHGKHTSTVGFWLPGSLEMMRYAAEFGARLLIIDPLAGAFMQNENDRALVRAFLSALDQWCEDNNCAVLIISHPAKHGDDAQSGSSDWRNGVQAVWDMSAARVKEGTKSIPAPNGERCLRLDKVNEASDRAPKIYLQWDSGRFVEVEPPEGADERQMIGAQAETTSTGKTRRKRTDGKQT
ncbi:MAG: AAA family ATPase [Caldilineaceae bacterium SB0675_bin_29]|uniref:AAA family ATPase n=1 Tax=Caldilineaceae bacterium SB0675_bin_29 TaxID=2605266 RepID=A0A6B1FZL5_9CHLR|nr:AAA family ATPase [Caldilineaceae bacterium SB0675_bin_29]